MFVILEIAQIEKNEIMPLSLPNNTGYVDVLKCPWKQGGNCNSQVVANKTCCGFDINMSLTECDTAGETRKAAVLLTTVNCPGIQAILELVDKPSGPCLVEKFTFPVHMV